MDCQFTPLDLQSWERGQIFCYFSKIAPTGYAITVEVDVTHMRAMLKSAGMKFYPAYLWLVLEMSENGKSANSFSELTDLLFPVHFAARCA